MVYGLWSMVYGLWSMVYGLWSMVYGLWSMVCGHSLCCLLLSMALVTRLLGCSPLQLLSAFVSWASLRTLFGPFCILGLEWSCTAATMLYCGKEDHVRSATAWLWLAA